MPENAPASVVRFRDRSHPNANGRTAQPGEAGYTVWFPLDDGRKLEVLLGREGIANLRKVIMDQFMDEEFEVGGPSSEVIQ